ncbi:UxaA family hydrolase [Undibacterium terreum]|uniref:Dehydratase n=1 Tax=Undibacterium terreum TaxID=1224302 RepID=A0A916UCX2_9BURK|nr:altronate dehydratase family protein [Undibacterium terreum]GGC69133.1 dehydratase [Undibacterium terreum]
MANPSTSVNKNALSIRLHVSDNVVIARRQLIGGTLLETEQVQIAGLIPAGHKLATADIAAGQAVIRYGQIIGFASQAILAGQHVHTHNLQVAEFEREHSVGVDARATDYVAEADSPTWQGIVRADGQVATRNYLGVLTSVNCSATAARAIADHFRRDTNPQALAGFPNVDGVIALTHGIGCGVDPDGEALAILRRTLSGYARHPNFAAVLFVGLGCETNQIAEMFTQNGLQENSRLRSFTIQDSGGTRKTVERGIAMIKDMLPAANQVQRQPLPVRHITVGLQCGGSDSYSGITANPALGAAMDLLVRHGGSAILSETPEIYGAEHLLTRRATPQIAEKLMARVHWWEDYCARMGAEMNNNPSSGNKAGGLTTILEKSLGAVAKAGSTNLVDVLEYAEAVKTKGLMFMDTPGYDPVSATGQVAGGANLICFTTGRGSAYGCAPSPSLKLASNTALWKRQEEDIDINCGDIADGLVTVEEVGQQIFELILDVASGKKTKSELHGYGQNEFVPWQIGAVM